MHTTRLLSTVLLAGTLAGPAAATTAPPTLDNPNRFAVSGTAAARRFFHLAATRRVDLALIGDSNARSQGDSGHEDGMGRALAGRFGMYATRVNPVMGQGGWGAGVMGEASQNTYPFSPTPDPLPAGPAAYLFGNYPMPGGFAFLPAGVRTSNGHNWGYWIYNDHPMGASAALRYHLTEYVTEPYTGSLTIEVRNAGQAYQAYASTVIAPADRVVPGVTDRSLDVPAGVRPPGGLLVNMSSLSQDLVSEGPLALMYHRLERPDRATGVGYSPLWEAGGQSARVVMLDYRDARKLRLPTREYLRQLVRLQNGAPVLCVHIMHGGNDIFDQNPSLGPVGGLPSNSPEGFRDNLLGIMAFLRACWGDMGYDQANLFFLLGPYHPRGLNEDVQRAFSQIWRDLAASDPQVFTVDGMRLTTAAELLGKGYLSNGTDPFHLATPGFRHFGRATVAAVDRALCPADYDSSGAADLLDIFAYLQGWFAASPDADFDYNGVDDLMDIFGFLGAWFDGCQPL